MPEVQIKSLIPHLVVSGASKALEFYQKAFGAEIVSQMPTPDGQRIIHAVLKIGGHELYVVDEMPDREEGSVMRSPREAKGTTVTIVLNVSDADAVYARAVKAGASEHMPLENTFWGARYGQLLDPYGHLWEVNQFVQQRSEAEMTAALEKEWAQSR